MPKKTKKDKIMAKLRRASASKTDIKTSTESPSGVLSPYTFTRTVDKKTQQTVSEYALELTTIKSDLFKTILLAIIAFSIELYVYWLLSSK